MRIVDACVCVLVGALVACGGGSDKITGTKATLDGKYSLVSIANQGLPVQLHSGSATLTFTAGDLSLDGQQFSMHLTIKEFSTPIEYKGPFTRTGNDVAFTLSDGDPADDLPMSLHWDGSNQLSPTGNSMPFLFQR